MTGLSESQRNLSNKFIAENRYNNFGKCVNSVEIKGFRGVECDINFEFPVTAITGLNGAGKTTIGQIMLCAYKRIKPHNKIFPRYYISTFFKDSKLDPNCFNDDATAKYFYQTEKPTDQMEIEISRKIKKWFYPKRQPVRASIYIGPAFYVPKSERSDITTYSNSRDIILTERSEVEQFKIWVPRILGRSYKDVFIQGVKSKSRKAEIGMANCFNAVYSENHMGFGEGRIIHIIHLLESCPEKSLIIMDEPEISLHLSAQREFAEYLMSVSNRRGHQIIMSTHSYEIADALPPSGRKMLERRKKSITVHDRISSAHVRNALSLGKDGRTTVFVEDEFAKSLLISIIHHKRRKLVERIEVLCVGSSDDVKNCVKALSRSKMRFVGVLDGDQTNRENLKDRLAVIPAGDVHIPLKERNPENLVFKSSAVAKYLEKKYSFDIDNFFKTHPEINHHKYLEKISYTVNIPAEKIKVDCIQKFVKSMHPDWANDLIKIIEDQEL